MARLLFQVHLWLGLLTGVYVSVMGITGSALVFRIEIQRGLYPGLFTPRAPGPLVDPLTVMERVMRAYPDHALSGVDAPTTARGTYLAYVTQAGSFRTVLVDPVSADVLGELPELALLRAIQQLHFSLMLGSSGRLMNGIGAACVLVMGVTGLALWWPGAGGGSLRPALASVRGTGRRATREIHRAVGTWSVVLLLMWAVTGLSFCFPTAFRSAIGWFSPVSTTRPPTSTAAGGNDANSRPTWAAQLERARQLVPDRPIARVVLPVNDRAAFLVMFAPSSPTPTGSPLEAVHLDQFTGRLLRHDTGPATAGDRVMSAMMPLHTGDVFRRQAKYVWFIIGMAPTVLCWTGLAMWWRRVVWPRQLHARPLRER